MPIAILEKAAAVFAVAFFRVSVLAGTLLVLLGFAAPLPAQLPPGLDKPGLGGPALDDRAPARGRTESGERSDPAGPETTAEEDADRRPPSPVERLYSERAGEPLRQFGYGLFESRSPEEMAAPGGAQEDYVLGAGDVLSVALRGSVDLDRQVPVRRDGLLLLPRLRPIPAAGRTLGEVRAELEAEVETALGATRLFVSVVELRQIVVQVLGEVGDPGRHMLTPFATVSDALNAAGGVNRLGSLRSLALIRDDLRMPIDLYRLLQEGDGSADHPLRDGDRLFVPPLGPAIAVAGAVRRPGIFELPPAEAVLAPDDAMALAGGPLTPFPARRFVLRIGSDGLERGLPLDRPDPAAQQDPERDPTRLRDGDILQVPESSPRQTGLVVLAGHVVAPGPQALAPGETLAGLIGGGAGLGPDPYLPFAALAVTDPLTGTRRLHPIDLGAILEGRSDRRLGDGDTLLVLSAEDVRFLTAAPVLALLRGEAPVPADVEKCRGLAALDQSLGGPRDNGLAGSALAAAAESLAPSGAECPDLFNEHPDLLPLALAHGVLIWEGVTRPGIYPAAGNMAVAALFSQAGVGGGRVPGGRAGPGAVIGTPAATVRLEGPVSLPGSRPLAEARTLSGLLDGGAALRHHDVYPLFGIVARLDRASRATRLFAFSPRAVLNREADLHLADGDAVHLFSASDIEALLAGEPLLPTEIRATAGGKPPPPETPPPLAAPRFDPASVQSFVRDHVITLDGAVRAPGAYPAAGETALAHLFETAGGTSRNAGLGDVEIIATDAPAGSTTVEVARTRVDLAALDPARIFVRPGDHVLIRPQHDPLADSRVAISGEVHRPGEYLVTRGERFSDLLRRAGGLTDQAYPDGTVFTRASARERQRADFRRQADALDRRIAGALLQPDPPSEGEVETAANLVAQLRAVEPLGRLVVEADPDRLAAQPELDIVLEGGDIIHIPARTPTVTVTGEVQAPATLQFRSGKGPVDYVREAGGYTRHADRDRVFVLFPDGSAQPVEASAWTHDPMFVPPGSVIVVPRDPDPFDFLAFSESIASVLSQIALTAASINVIRD